MLAGVLLHVVEPAVPVHHATCPLSRERAREEVRHPIPLVHHVHDGDAAEAAGIMGLAAGGGVEGGPIEVDPAAVVRARDDGGVEVAEVGVGIVEAVGHGWRIGGKAERRNGGRERADGVVIPRER
jgi:hypothetical protein